MLFPLHEDGSVLVRKRKKTLLHNLVSTEIVTLYVMRNWEKIKSKNTNLH